MIYDHPVLPVLNKHKTVSSRKGFLLPVFAIREGIISSIDSGIAINTYQLLAERYLHTRQNLERADEIVTKCRSVRPHLWRKCAPEDCVWGIEIYHLIRIVLR